MLVFRLWKIRGSISPGLPLWEQGNDSNSWQLFQLQLSKLFWPIVICFMALYRHHFFALLWKCCLYFHCRISQGIQVFVLVCLFLQFLQLRFDSFFVLTFAIFQSIDLFISWGLLKSFCCLLFSLLSFSFPA